MRDDFSKATIERLAKRAGYLCSNPHCRLPTIGAALSHEGVVNIGLAAHITAAAPGGPRYDASLTPEQRRHESNGLWLCRTDGKLVDSDESHFTVAMLREWKTQAEQSSFRAILSGQNSSVASQKPSSDRSIESLLQRIRGAAVADLAGFKRAPSWPRHPIALNLRVAAGGTERQFNAETVGALLSAFNELIVVAPPGTGKTTTLIQIDKAILAPLRIADDTRDELTKLISRWVDALISSAETEDRQFADVARAIGRVAAPELATPLRRLLEEDRVRGRDSRVAHALSLERHGLERADAYISWATPYREAFAAIGDRAVADVMMSYLGDVGYCGFGVDAAYVLRQIWRTQRSLVLGHTESEPVFSSRRQRVVARAHSDEPQHRYAEAILKVIDGLVTSSSEQSQRHALLLAIVAFSMPYGERSATVRALINLPQPLAAKQGLLRVLAEAGELLPGDLVFDGIRGLLEEATAKPWLVSDQDGWRLNGWLRQARERRVSRVEHADEATAQIG